MSTTEELKKKLNNCETFKFNENSLSILSLQDIINSGDPYMLSLITIIEYDNNNINNINILYDLKEDSDKKNTIIYNIKEKKFYLNRDATINGILENKENEENEEKSKELNNKTFFLKDKNEDIFYKIKINIKLIIIKSDNINIILDNIKTKYSYINYELLSDNLDNKTDIENSEFEELFDIVLNHVINTDHTEYS